MTSALRIEWIIRAGAAVATDRYIKSILKETQYKYYFKYSEPGYSLGEDEFIVLSNWNDKTEYIDGQRVVIDNTMSRVGDLLERCGGQLEWEDEWRVCNNCMGIFRTSPDNHGWSPSYHMYKDDYEEVCSECILEEACYFEEYLKEHEGNDRSCITFYADDKLEEFGYRRVNIDYESGFHHGQNDDPNKIGQSLWLEGLERYIFVLDGKNQFEIDFSVWVHEDELKERNITVEDVEAFLRHELDSLNDLEEEEAE